ncbi:Rrf2 family transcriptional regulator [Acidobacteriia bacterium AH_259_A11_L15]|nr:Rrf2 family transcriptional regulator [Acidobacteriia bacterium AH_259_A11_L15]
MLYSRPCEYAIRAVAHLAQQPRSRFVTVAEIARGEDIRVPFLARILHQLARAGLLLSRKGPGGGFQLVRPAREIKLREIIASIEGLDGLEQCVVGLAECSDQMPCPVHAMWKEVRARITRRLQRTTLADMAQAVARKRKLRTAAKG